jgi:hypothetical protein
MEHTLFDPDIYVEPRTHVTVELTLHLSSDSSGVAYGYVIYDTETRDWLAAEVPGIVSDRLNEYALTDLIWVAVRRAESFLTTF